MSLEAPSARPWTERLICWSSLGNIVRVLFVLGGLAAIGMITFAVWTGATTALRGALLDLVCILLVTNFVLFLRSIEAEKRISIESEWGGLGGGLGGWRVSSSLIFLIISVALFVVLAMLINADAPSPNLFERYRAAMNLAENKGAEFTTRSIVGGKLVLRGTVSAPEQDTVDAFWTQAKLANHAAYEDLNVLFTTRVASPTAGPSANGAAKAPAVRPRNTAETQATTSTATTKKQ